MTGRHGYDSRERQNEYFVPGDGITREVIQADICRYLGNDALVRPGNHNGRQGYFIRAYRNLTSEMIADLKADSARWEAELMRRADQGYPRGSYNHHLYLPQSPDVVPAPYQTSAIHEVRQEMGPSATPPFSSAPGQTYMDPYAQNPYGTQSPPYQPPPSYPPGPSPFAQGQVPYSQAQIPPYSGQSQPPVTAEMQMHQAYTYAPNTGYSGYDPGRNNAPRYPGPGYETEQDYSPVTTGMVTSTMAYPPTTAPDMRIPMDPRYTPESTYPDRNSRPAQPTRTGRR